MFSPTGSKDYSEQTTESHLAKKYNDILYDVMMRCNATGFIQESTPHYDNLKAYFAAVYVLFRNTFMLFYGINMGGDTLAKILFNKMQEIKEGMRLMKTSVNYRSPEFFAEITAKCDIVHMLIMDGLQKRNMLVRIGQMEPKGQESVFYWDDKSSFKKGGLTGDTAKIIQKPAASVKEKWLI